jgi:hypothetical protein
MIPRAVVGGRQSTFETPTNRPAGLTISLSSVSVSRGKVNPATALRALASGMGAYSRALPAGSSAAPPKPRGAWRAPVTRCTRLAGGEVAKGGVPWSVQSRRMRCVSERVVKGTTAGASIMATTAIAPRAGRPRISTRARRMGASARSSSATVRRCTASRYDVAPSMSVPRSCILVATRSLSVTRLYAKSRPRICLSLFARRCANVARAAVPTTWLATLLRNRPGAAACVRGRHLGDALGSCS